MINLADLQTAVTDAASIAQDIASDPHLSQSPVAAAIRSALDHVNELVAAHAAWVAANPVPVPAAATAPAAATPAPGA